MHYLDRLSLKMSSMPISKSAARAAISTIFFLNGFGFATWVSRIPAVRHALNLTDGALGTALLAIAVGALVAFPLTGRSTTINGARALTIATGRSEEHTSELQSLV